VTSSARLNDSVPTFATSPVDRAAAVAGTELQRPSGNRGAAGIVLVPSKTSVPPVDDQTAHSGYSAVNVPELFVTVRVCVPNITYPKPASEVMEAPLRFAIHRICRCR